MPIPAEVNTSYIIQNFQDRVNSYNNNFNVYIEDYQKFILKRKMFLYESQEIPSLLMKEDFINELRWILDKFGMNARLSKLTDKPIFSKVLEESAPVLKKITRHESDITHLNFNASNESRNYYESICEIYELYSERGRLSDSGGFVIASKTLHFILPELFIMIDGSHIGISLYNIDDYEPFEEDGDDWYEAIPNYSGKKPNPSPRGLGRKNWDSERYCRALMYYKRIYEEWKKEFNLDFQAFQKIDIKSNFVTRIIDKSLW